MIEYRYFNRLTKENKEAILNSLDKALQVFMDEEDYIFLSQDMHLEICDTLRNQKKYQDDKHK